MLLLDSVTIEACQDHLRRQGTGVSLDVASMPKPADGYATFRATLEDGDVDRIFLWFEFRKHTKNGSGKLTDALLEFISEKRIRRLVEGDKAKGWGPIDLRTASRFEPMLLTNDVVHGPLYAIDGNHRLVAQFLSRRGLAEVPVYVCTHAKMLEWEYITDAARVWYKQQVPNRSAD
jgi:hypothetical protein